MTYLHPALTRDKYPIRFWSLLVFIIGFPNFLKWDSTGVTHNQGLFNLTSITSIAITLSTGLILVGMTMITRTALFQRPMRFPTWIWLALLANLILSSVLQPSVIAGHLTKPLPTDLALSLYRLAEWTLAVVVVLSLVSRESEQSASDMTIRVIGIVCWSKLLLIWTMLPIVPKLVYAANEESDSGIARLGGTMVNPVHLAIFASIAFFYSIMFVKGRRWRVFGALLALATLGLTYSRSVQLFFVVMVLFYLFYTRSSKLRLMGVLSILLGVLGSVVLSDKIVKYLSRGQGTKNIATLSERTIVWKISEHLLGMRPLLGYGYIAGPKHAIFEEWNYTHWVPPHAHSDFLQAALSGGVIAGLLMVLIYGGGMWTAFRRLREGPSQVFLFLILFQISAMSIIEVLLTTQFTDLGGVFLLTYIGVVATPKAVTSASRQLAPAIPMKLRYQ